MNSIYCFDKKDDWSSVDKFLIRLKILKYKFIGINTIEFCFCFCFFKQIHRVLLSTSH